MNPYHDYGVYDAITFPTRCKICRRKVFYYSNDCGSRVFFDKLGPPWPKHDCEYQDMLDSLKWYAENWRESGLTLNKAARRMSQISQGILSPAQCKAELLRAIKKN